MERPNSAVIETRVSRELLAELAVFLHKHGPSPPTSISHMIRMALELLRDVIISKGMLTPVNDVLDATRALERVGLGKLQKGERGTKSYFDALSRQEEKTLGDPFDGLIRKAAEDESKVDEELQEGMRQYHEKEREKKAIMEESDEQAATDKSQLRDQKEKEALAKGPDESTIIKEEQNGRQKK